MRYLFVTFLFCFASASYSQSYNLSYLCSPVILCTFILEETDVLDNCGDSDSQDLKVVIDFTDTLITYHYPSAPALELPVLATARFDNYISFFFVFHDISLLASLFESGKLSVYAVNAFGFDDSSAALFTCEATQ